MTLVRPFSALRFDPRHVDLARAIAPPYDVIAPDERAALYDRDPHNAIRLELTRDTEEQSTTDYADVRRTLDRWLREGVLVRDARPALYGLRQRYLAPDGSSGVREGFFALLHLEDYDRRVVRPHERTLAAPKADRLKLLQATRINASSVFLLYEDHGGALAGILAPEMEAPPVASAKAEPAASHELMRIGDPERIEAVQAFFADRPVVIADGHHRYETALAYRDQRRAAKAGAPSAPAAAAAGPDWILAYFANAFAPGTLLLPIHRLIRKGSVPTEAAWTARLPHWRQRAVRVESAEAIPGLLAEHLTPLADRHAFAADDGSGVLRVFSRPPSAELGVRVIHREVIAGVFGLDEKAVCEGAIDYPKDARQTARELRAGRGSVALYLNPLTPDDVFRVTDAGELMPQKSTFFFPKLPTGLLFRELGEPA